MIPMNAIALSLGKTSEYCDADIYDVTQRSSAVASNQAMIHLPLTDMR
jgi:hypothetical protein